MADNKKYYYLKLKENFFDSDAMLLLESMPDGYIYSNILLKLYLRSLKNAGKLMFNDKIPYNPNMISTITRTSVGVVEKALSIFKELNLVEILDNGAIYMTDIQNFIGLSSTEGDRKREYRDKIEQEKKLTVGQMSAQMSGQMSAECPDKHPPEIEIELEIKKELEINNTPFIPQTENEVSHQPVAPTSKKKKIKFSEFVSMTNDEYQSLIANKYLGSEEAVKRCIEILDAYKGSCGKRYKDDYRAILSWVIDRYLEEFRRTNANGKDICGNGKGENSVAGSAGAVPVYGKRV